MTVHINPVAVVLVRPKPGGGEPFLAFGQPEWLRDAGGKYGWISEWVAWDERYGAFTREAFLLCEANGDGGSSDAA